jgi:hypothetical protein
MADAAYLDAGGIRAADLQRGCCQGVELVYGEPLREIKPRRGYNRNGGGAIGVGPFERRPVYFENSCLAGRHRVVVCDLNVVGMEGQQAVVHCGHRTAAPLLAECDHTLAYDI